MKKCVAFVLFLKFACAFSQSNNKVENLIIVTLDGFRWHEVFKGIDSGLVENPVYNQDKKLELYKKFGGTTNKDSRKNLLPFFWNTIAVEGSIYGNRTFGNKVDNSNPYWFSYPGYSEIFCGWVDTAINSNAYKANPNSNVLEFINKQASFNKKVAAFGAWNAFDRILNEQRSNFPVTCGGETVKNNDPLQLVLGEMKRESYTPFDTAEYLDVFTNYQALKYLETNLPRVMYISYGETDEWAHAGHYADYLEAAHRTDEWLSDLWNKVQAIPQYKNKTALFITVDHGRGYKNIEEWTSHNSKISDSHEIWFALISPSVKPKGEVTSQMQIYQKQFAQTFAKLLGLNFTCEHLVATEVTDVFVK